MNAEGILDRVRTAVRLRHDSRRTEQAYVAWIRRYIVFHQKDGLILLPGGSRIKRHYVYIMLFGGVFWSCAVSGHREGCPVPANLRDDGTLTLLVQDWTKNSAVLDLAKQMKGHLRSGAV